MGEHITLYIMNDMYVCALLRDGAPVPHGNSGTVWSGMGSPCAVRGCNSARLSTCKTVRVNPHIYSSWSMYVHELSTCALTAVDRHKALVSLCTQIFAVFA